MSSKSESSSGWPGRSRTRKRLSRSKTLRPKNKTKKSWIASLFTLALTLYLALHIVWAIALFALRFVNPPTTGVQIQRRVESWFSERPYGKRVRFVPLSRISPNLQHAVIASEDGRFYQHHGIDWDAVQKVVEQSADKGKVTRGASTIPQQLVKNLFFTTHRNPIRKGFEYTLAPMADFLLGKRRELELYLNVVEWGPGIWGADAAAQYHYRTTAAKLDRDQAARLAACLPSPRRYRPAMMNDFSASIEERMRQVGW